MGDKPNIIIFFTDQQRWDTVGCYGQKLPVTPNLDHMADEGVKFTLAFTPQPVCGPARSCLQTGKYATETGCWRNGIALPSGERTLAHWLSGAGYETGYIGKWHLASTDGSEDYTTKPIPPKRRGGYDDFWLAADLLEFTSHGYDGYMFDKDMRRVEFTGYRADCLTDFALDYLRTRDGRWPFFLFVSYLEPHHQNDRKRYEGPIGSAELFAGYETPGDLADTEGDWREQFPDYLGCCHSLDYNLGRMLAELERLGLAENTVIFYTSDHGSHFRTRNNEYKRSCHEGCIRIPFVVRGPGFQGGITVEHELISLIDLPPTILACAGIAKPETMRGRPLQELLAGARDWPQEVFLQISESQVGRAIRTKRWKYSVRAPDKDGWRDADAALYVEDFLYDLKSDPHERANLVAKPDLKDIRRELANILIRKMKEAGEEIPVIRPYAPV